MGKFEERAPAKNSRTAVTVTYACRRTYTNGTGDCKVLLKMTRRSLQLFTGDLRNILRMLIQS